MQNLVQIEAADRKLLDAISAAHAEAARRSGDWLVCRLGCTNCCLGPFAITRLDALRLQKALAALAAVDPARAEQVRVRAAGYVSSIASQYPGDTATGELRDEDLLPDSMDELPCPALDPETGACDVYAARPVTCRVFGPVTRAGDGTYAACELCYEGATEVEMIACSVEMDPDGLERELIAELDRAGQTGLTIVAYALVG